MQVCKTVYLFRIFTVFSHVIFVLFILVYKTVIKIQPTNASTQLFVLVHLQSVPVLNYLSMNPSSLPSRKNISSHWLLSWLEPFFVCVQPEVCSTAYQTILVLQLFRSEPGMCCSFQSIHLYFLPKETKAVEKVGREKQYYCC